MIINLNYDVIGKDIDVDINVVVKGTSLYVIFEKDFLTNNFDDLHTTAGQLACEWLEQKNWKYNGIEYDYREQRI